MDASTRNPTTIRRTLAGVAVFSILVCNAESQAAGTGLVPAWFLQTSADQGAQGLAVALDSLGNSLVAGKFSSVASIGGMSVSSDSTTGIDVYVGKLDPSGKAVWLKRAGGPGSDEVRGMAVDQKDDVILTGAFSNSIDFGGGPVAKTGLASFFVTKLAGKDGAHVWTHVFSVAGTIPANQKFAGLAVDSVGNVLVTGRFEGTLSMGASTSLVSMASPSGSSATSDAFVVKLDGTSGNVIWSKRFGGAGGDGGNAVAVDKDKNVLVAGTLGSQAAAFGGVSLSTHGASSDAFLAKLDGTDGTVLFAKDFGGDLYDEGFAVGADDLGNIYTAGVFNAAVSFGGSTLTADGTDAFVVKLNGSGSHVWSTKIGGTDKLYDSVDVLAVSHDGARIVTAGVLNGSRTLAGVALIPQGLGGAFITEMNGIDGTITSAAGVIADRLAEAHAIALGANGATLVGGLFMGTASTAPGGASLSTHAGADSFFLLLTH
jgi:hypothetical protein